MSGSTLPFFLQTFHWPDGRPLAGGKAWFYVAGSTSIPKPVYFDKEQTIVLTQPLVMDATGTLPQYFGEDGYYKILITTPTDVLLHTRDDISGYSLGTGAGVDSFQVKTTAVDTAPDYLRNKVIDTPSVKWSISNSGGAVSLQADVDTANILDGRIKTDSSDVLSYLESKLANTASINLSVNTSTHKLEAYYVGPVGIPATGGVFTGPVSFTNQNTVFKDITTEKITASGDITTEGDVESTNTITNHVNTETITLRNTTTPGMLSNDAGGNVISIPGLPFQVKHSETDAHAGYLGAKLRAGTGITINTTEDGVNGTVMHINTQLYNGVLVLAKTVNAAYTTTTTPVDILQVSVSSSWGSYTIVQNTTRPGYMYRLTIKFPSSTAAFLLDIALSSITGGGVVPNIPIPAGASQIEFDVLFTSIAYGTNTEYSYTIISSASPYIHMAPGGGWGVWDTTQPMVFTAKAHHIGATASTITPYATLWKM
jgi:hypothetical protein